MITELRVRRKTRILLSMAQNKKTNSKYKRIWWLLHITFKKEVLAVGGTCSVQACGIEKVLRFIAVA